MLLYYPYLLGALLFTHSNEEMLVWQGGKTHMYAGKR